MLVRYEQAPEEAGGGCAHALAQFMTEATATKDPGTNTSPTLQPLFTSLAACADPNKHKTIQVSDALVCVRHSPVRHVVHNVEVHFDGGQQAFVQHETAEPPHVDCGLQYPM